MMTHPQAIYSPAHIPIVYTHICVPTKNKTKTTPKTTNFSLDYGITIQYTNGHDQSKPGWHSLILHGDGCVLLTQDDYFPLVRYRRVFPLETHVEQELNPLGVMRLIYTLFVSKPVDLRRK